MGAPPRPAVDGTDADHEQHSGPRDEGEGQEREDVAAHTRVAATSAKDVLAEDGELDRPEHERQRDRHAGECEDVARATVGALRAEGLAISPENRQKGLDTALAAIPVSAAQAA